MVSMQRGDQKSWLLNSDQGLLNSDQGPQRLCIASLGEKFAKRVILFYFLLGETKRCELSFHIVIQSSD